MPDPTAPRLGVGLAVAPPATLLALAYEIGRRLPVADIGDVSDHDPVLVRVSSSDPVPKRRSGPSAWWVDGGPLPARTSGAPVIVLSEEPAVLSLAEKAGLRFRVVPSAEVEPESSPVAPFVRARLREARGLGDGLLEQKVGGVLHWDGGPGLDPATTTTALAAAAAAYLDDPRLVIRALAWGCPVVTTLDVCRQTGVTAGLHVVLDDGTDPLDQLRRTAEDPRLTARLSASGRLRYEQAHSLSACADEVTDALGLSSRWLPSHLEGRLTELDARRGDAPRRRFDEMVGTITDEGS